VPESHLPKNDMAITHKLLKISDPVRSSEANKTSESFKTITRRLILPAMGLFSFTLSSCNKEKPATQSIAPPLPLKYETTERQKKLDLKLGYQGVGFFSNIAYSNSLSQAEIEAMTIELKKYFHAGDFFAATRGKELRDVGLENVSTLLEIFDANFFIRLLEDRSRELKRLGIPICIELAKRTSAKEFTDSLMLSPWRLIDRKENFGSNGGQTELLEALALAMKDSAISNLLNEADISNKDQAAFRIFSSILSPIFAEDVNLLVRNDRFSPLAQEVFDFCPNLSEILCDTRLSDTHKRNAFKLFLVSCAHLCRHSGSLKPNTVRNLSEAILYETDLRPNVQGVANSNLQFSAKELYGLPKSVLLGVAVHEFEHKLRTQMTPLEEYAGDLAAMDIVYHQFDQQAVKNLQNFLDYSHPDSRLTSPKEPHRMARTQLSRIFKELDKNKLPLDYHEFYVTSRKLQAEGNFFSGPQFADFVDAHLKSYMNRMVELWQVNPKQRTTEHKIEVDSAGLLSSDYLRKFLNNFQSLHSPVNISR
jgi:hypothetical protein